jgi:alpha-tubulin suppressor-like RCC1 family protein
LFVGNIFSFILLLYFNFNEFALLRFCQYFTAGNIVCSWGRGEDGQLGHGDAEDRLSPIQLSALDDHEIVSVTSGADHTTAYSQSRLEVYSWGWSV